MLLKKIIVWFFVFIALFSKVDAQQSFSKMVADVANNKMTTVTHDLANGTNHNTVDGPKYYNSYNNTWTILIYNENTNTRYEPTSRLGLPSTPNPSTNEPIGVGTASYKNNHYKDNASSFKNQNNSSQTLPIWVESISSQWTINGNPDTDAIQILRQEYILSNINSLPDNTRVFIGSRPWSLMPSGARNWISDGMKKVNGVRTEPAQDPRWWPLNNVGPTLGLDNPENPFHAATVGPNPAQEFVRFTDGLSGNNTYDLKILSIQGSIAQEIKRAPEDTNLDISRLVPGMYIIIATDPKTGNSFTKKIIKK